jgi:hypothetical protein
MVPITDKDDGRPFSNFQFHFKIEYGSCCMAVPLPGRALWTLNEIVTDIGPEFK